MKKGRGNSRRTRRLIGEPTAAREALERRWFHRLKPVPQLAPLVTGAALCEEPFHRWLSYKQAFAPELVRLFLNQEHGVRWPTTGEPLLDPFAGSGTFPIECARRGVAALGIEALASLAFLASSRSASEFPDLPDLRGALRWQDFAERLTVPIHRAALICAVARRHSSDGNPLRNPRPLIDEFTLVADMIREDLRSPLAKRVSVDLGDARRMSDIADDSIGGILTSPPYLSRHDYTKLTRPHQQVHGFWHPAASQTERRAAQVRAHPKAYRGQRSEPTPPAVGEACDALRARGEDKLAGIVRSYFEDISAALTEFARVLRPDRPCWLVVGAARLKDVYIPSDTILADVAQGCGFTVSELRVARTLTPAGRKLGGLDNISPRESLIVLRRST